LDDDTVTMKTVNGPKSK